jgi:hypothetical protein
MTRWQGTLFPLLALLFAALFLASLLGWRFTPSSDRFTAPSPFHEGKRQLSARGDAACSSPTCHAPSPHRKPGPVSAFLNMHESSVSCLACHGRDPEVRWGPGEAPAGTPLRLVYLPLPAPGEGGRRHGANGPPAPCRRCHSTEGRTAIAASGVKLLLEGFKDPIALRMIEGGGRKWLPDDIR